LSRVPAKHSALRRRRRPRSRATLRVGGTVTVDLLRRLREAPQISGVGHVDLSSVRVTLPATLETLRRSIESYRVLFGLVRRT
jgi:hypothetical protein